MNKTDYKKKKYLDFLNSEIIRLKKTLAILTVCYLVSITTLILTINYF